MQMIRVLVAANFSQFDDVFFEDLLRRLDVPTPYEWNYPGNSKDNFVLGGWVGYTNTQLLSTLGGLVERGGIDILTML